MEHFGQMQEFVLEKLAIQDQIVLSDAVLASIRIGNIKLMKHYAGGMAAQVIDMILDMPSEKLPDQVDEVSCESPLGLWQTFKHYHFPEWLKRRFPVKMERFTLRTVVKLSAIYPELPLHVTDCGRVSIFIDKRTENTRVPV